MRGARYCGVASITTITLHIMTEDTKKSRPLEEPQSPEILDQDVVEEEDEA